MTSPDYLQTFPLARYRLEFVTERAIHLPEYAGSALRGAFGHELRRAACVTAEPDCRACSLYRSCPYPAIFETPPPLDYARRNLSNVPHPFIVEPPPWGEQTHPVGSPLEFGLVLIGPARAQLPLVLLAWRRALQRGLGPQEGTARLLRVFVEGDPQPVLADPEGRIRPHAQQLAVPAPQAALSEVTLEFDTPLRLQRNGQVIGVGELTPQLLLMALLRRTAQLVELQLGGALNVDFAELNTRAATITAAHQLAWRDWTRHSNRQHQRMVLGGTVGRWTLRGDLAAFWPLLYLGQWLHVGKNATFGLGRYRLLENPT
jgi:CRISPR/Cas system endoribonuclease Cas6 (RAMP superfamily)